MAMPAMCSLLYRVEDRRIQSYFLGGKYPEVEEAAHVAICLEQYPLATPVALDDLAEQSGVPSRKARIVFALLKRHGLVREHRGGSWERLGSRLTSVDLSADLTITRSGARRTTRSCARWSFCQTTECRTRYILEYFGEEVDAEWRAGTATPATSGRSGTVLRVLRGLRVTSPRVLLETRPVHPTTLIHTGSPVRQCSLQPKRYRLRANHR